MNNELQTTEFDSFDLSVEKASEIYLMSENASKIFMLADAVALVANFLTPQRMKSIMMLQGKKIGFKTDKVYDENTVMTCIIDAMMTGVLATGNQFNIIAGNMYVTKEGFFHLLKNHKELEDYDIEPDATTFKQEGGIAVLSCLIKYKKKDENQKQFKRTYRIKNDARYGSYDAVVGKLERKARKDLYEKLTGIEILDGDADSVTGLDPKKEVKQTQTATSPFQQEEDTLFNEQEQLEILKAEAEQAE